MYSVIDENFRVFKIQIRNLGKEIVFSDIKEEDKDVELENAARLRFRGDYVVVTEFTDINRTPVLKYINSKNDSQWLKLIKNTEDKVQIQIPSLSGMA